MSRDSKKLNIDSIFHKINCSLMAILFVIFTYPLWFVLIASISDPAKACNGDVLLLPKSINFACYENILAYKDIWVGYANTIINTLLGTLINLILTIALAYPLSRKDFMLKNLCMTICMITMYFSGGLVPTYLLISKLHMVDTRWALLIPGAISFYNVIITKTYFSSSIPMGLQEAADIDGANSFQYLMKIILPLSKPILAVITLYYAVGHWNSFFNAFIYIKRKVLYPLQLVLRNILISSNISEDLLIDSVDMVEKMQIAETLKYGVIVVSAFPLLCVFPFIQKYFKKGVMIGAIKG